MKRKRKIYVSLCLSDEEEDLEGKKETTKKERRRIYLKEQNQTTSGIWMMERIFKCGNKEKVEREREKKKREDRIA